MHLTGASESQVKAVRQAGNSLTHHVALQIVALVKAVLSLEYFYSIYVFRVLTYLYSVLRV